MSDSAPEACTLPTADLTRRLDEIDALFATAVVSVTRSGDTALRLGLTPGPSVAARAADLLARESSCCSFFTFTLTLTGDRLTLDVAVPQAYADVLDGMQERVLRAMAGG